MSLSCPNKGRGIQRRLDFIPGEVDDLGVGEQAAVEMVDDVGAEFAPRGHCLEEISEPREPSAL